MGARALSGESFALARMGSSWSASCAAHAAAVVVALSRSGSFAQPAHDSCQHIWKGLGVLSFPSFEKYYDLIVLRPKDTIDASLLEEVVKEMKAAEEKYADLMTVIHALNSRLVKAEQEVGETVAHAAGCPFVRASVPGSSA